MEEEILTIEEDAIFSGVSSVNGLTGDVPLKTINGQEVTGEGDIEIEGGDGQVKSVNNVEPDENGNVELTAATIGAQATLDQAQLTAVNSGIDSTKVAQIATNTAAIAGKQGALNAAQLTAVNSGIDSTKVAQIATNVTDIDGIEAKIPAQATSSNQLADKDFVNSSVATNTANYISDNGQPFQSYADLVAYSGPLTNNDYAFVETIDQAGNDTYTRYKYNASTTTWAEEYVLNNSSFTSTQWGAINSGISSSDVTKLGGIEAGAEVNDIDSISLNGTALTPDANKNVEITTPTYSDFTGTDGTAAGTHGLVPAPATTDAGKYLKADGTWGTVQAGPTVVQTIGTSTTDVMSQNAIASMIYHTPSAQLGLRIGKDAVAHGTSTVFGNRSSARTNYAVALGQDASAQGEQSIAFPGGSTSVKGVVEFGLNASAAWGTYGYNDSAYRLLSGVYDPQSAHDAATKGYVDGLVGDIESALQTINNGGN